MNACLSMWDNISFFSFLYIVLALFHLLFLAFLMITLKRLYVMGLDYFGLFIPFNFCLQADDTRLTISRFSSQFCSYWFWSKYVTRIKQRSD